MVIRKRERERLWEKKEADRRDENDLNFVLKTRYRILNLATMFWWYFEWTPKNEKNKKIIGTKRRRRKMNRTDSSETGLIEYLILLSNS